MTTIYTRAEKGSALTWTEGDANITNLNNDKIEAVVEDLAPQLGGNLDVNGNSIVSVSNGNITIAPDGTGQIVLDGQTWPAAAPATNGEYLSATSAGVLAWTDRVNAKTIYETVKNDSVTETLAKGTPVYQSGVTGNTITVGAARADDINKLAIGVLDEALAPEAEGRMLVLGEIKGVDTSSFATGDKVYLGETGGYTNIAPTSSSVAVQFLGVVNRIDASNGSGYITGTLTEDVVRYNSSTSNFEFWTGSTWTGLSFSLDSLTDVAITSPSDGQLLKYDTTSGVWINATVASGIASLYDDPSPQLSAFLDVNNQYISTSITNGNVFLAGDGTGTVVIQGDFWPLGHGTSGQVLTTDGTGTLSWTSAGGVSTLDGLSDVTITSPSNGQILSYDTGTSSWINSAAPSAGIASLYDDPSPQLSAFLDVNNQYISTSITNGNVFLAGDGTGTVVIQGNFWPSGYGTSGQVLTTDGTGTLSWSSAGGGASNLADLSDVTITTPSDDQFLRYDTTSSKWINESVNLGITELYQDTTPQLSGSLDVNGQQITTSVTNGNILIFPDGSGYIQLDNHIWPTSDGTSGQVLTTDGAGNLSWSSAGGVTSLAGLDDVTITTPSDNQFLRYDTASSKWINETVSLGITEVLDDTTPQLGGSLDVNGQQITTSVTNGNILLVPIGTGKTIANNINYYETPYTLSYAGTITPDVANGNVQIVTLTGNVTFSAFTNPIAGQNLTLIVKQDGTGGRTLTSTMKFAGGIKTLSGTANAVDIITVFYDGTNYWANLSKGYA